MYSEEIKYLSRDSDDNTHVNIIRNAYFENRSCLINVLDFLDQEVVIIPHDYLSYSDGKSWIMEDEYFHFNADRWDLISYSLYRIEYDNGYHLSISDNYITIVAKNMRCVFTNRDMKKGEIIGTIIWVKNFNELLKKFGDRNLKRISKAVVCPLVKISSWGREQMYFDVDFFLSMDIYYPEIAFKYTFDTYMSNVCIDVYNNLVKCGLNKLVDKYMPSYKQCDRYKKNASIYCYITDVCNCGGLRTICNLYK